jgi:hypothetical protein
VRAPWSSDTLQGSAYGALLVRALERSEAAEGMALTRLSFDLWRPVTRERITPSVTILRDGRKARTAESSFAQGGEPVARCTGVFLKANAAPTPILIERKPPPVALTQDARCRRRVKRGARSSPASIRASSRAIF